MSPAASTGPRPDTSPHLRWPWRAYLLVGIASMGAFHLLPGKVTQHAYYVAIYAASALAVLVGAALHRPARAGAWYAAALALGIAAAGNAAYGYRDVVAGAEMAFGHLPDILYSMAYLPILAAALLWARQARGHIRKAGAERDIGIIVAAFAVSAWLLVWGPVDLADVSWTTGLLLVWRPAVGVVLLGVAAALAMTTTRLTPAVWGIIAVLSIHAAVDLAWIITALEGTYVMPSALDTGWHAYPILAGVAALHPSMVTVGDPAGASEPVRRRQVTCLAIAVFLLPASVLLQALRGVTVDAAALGLGVFLMAALCLDRLAHWIDEADSTARHATRLLEELERANAALTEGEQQARAAATAHAETIRRYDHATWAGEMAVWAWDVPGRCVVRSPHAEALFDLPGAAPSALDPWLARLHPDDRDAVSEAVRLAGATRRPFEVDYRVILDSGEVRWVRDIGRPAKSPPGHMHGVMLDVTERERAADALRTREAASRSILDSLPAATVVLDAGGTIVARNAAWAQAVCEGTGQTWRLGDNYLDLWRDRPGLLADDRDAVTRGVRAVIERAQVEFARDYQTWPGDKWFQVRALPLRGTADGVVISHLDITTQKRTEVELRHSQKMDAVGQLAGGVAHDFNNLLTVISGFAEIAQGKLTDAGQATLATAEIAEIARAADQGALLVSQLLSFGRRHSSESISLDVGEAVTAMETMLSRVLGDHIEIRTELADDLWPV
jgi:PAS domain-containing protein